MISLFFNERGFILDGPLGEAKQIFDVPVGVTQDATALYCFRWHVFNAAMQQLDELGQVPAGEELLLYTDSRLVEELNGELKTDHEFAQKSRLYYITYDLPKFRRVRVEKCAPTAIQRRLDESSLSERTSGA